MKTKTPTHTVGRLTFQAYDKYPPFLAPALTAPDLAKLYDRAAKQIELLVHALKLCAPLTPAAEAARSAAFDAVMEDLKS